MCRLKLSTKERLERFCAALQQVYTCHGVACLLDRYFPIRCLCSNTYKKYALDIFEKQYIELQRKNVGDITKWECSYTDTRAGTTLLWHIQRRQHCQQYDEPVWNQENCRKVIETQEAQDGGF